jgi:hypothetical protein
MTRPRNAFLLSADATQRIYLDLATGAEFVERITPAPAPPPASSPTQPPLPPTPAVESARAKSSEWSSERPLSDEIAECLDALDLKYSIDEDGFALRYSGALSGHLVRIRLSDRGRNFSVRAHLGLWVPRPRVQDVKLATVELSTKFGLANVLYHTEDDVIELYHPVLLGDTALTPTFLDAQLYVIVDTIDAARFALAAVVAGECAPADVVAYAHKIDERLRALWSEHEAGDTSIEP